MRTSIRMVSSALVFLTAAASLFSHVPGQQQEAEFVKQGQQVMRDGKLEDALELYAKTLRTSPSSPPANIAAGSVLDLMERYAEARKYFQKAIDIADTPEHKARRNGQWRSPTPSKGIARRPWNTNS